MGVTIKNLGRLQAKLKRLDPLTRSAVMTGVQLAAIKVEGDAKSVAPVDTGALRRSIRTTSRTLPNGAEAAVGSSLDYAPYVELGTSTNSAQPYLQPSLQKNKKIAKRLIISEIVKAHRSI